MQEGKETVRYYYDNNEPRRPADTWENVIREKQAPVAIPTGKCWFLASGEIACDGYRPPSSASTNAGTMQVDYNADGTLFRDSTPWEGRAQTRFGRMDNCAPAAPWAGLRD